MSKDFKGSNILHVLDVLREYSDAEHKLSQSDILRLLRSRYDVEMERRSVKSAIVNLIDAGYDISYREVTRAKGTDDENTAWTDFYLEKDFTDGELRILIDSVLCAKLLPERFASEIVEKLKRMGSRAFRRIHYAKAYIPCGESNNLLLFAEDIGCAVSTGKQVKFMLGEYDDKGKLKPVWDEAVLFNPYRLASVNNFYYMIGTVDGQSEPTHFRVDKIINLKLTENPSANITFDAAEYIDAHPYMAGGRVLTAEIMVTEDSLHLLSDTFGQRAVKVIEKTDGKPLRVTVRAGRDDLHLWAMQNPVNAFILSPIDLYNEVKGALTGWDSTILETDEHKYNEAMYYASLSGSANFSNVSLRGRSLHKRLIHHFALGFHNNGISDFSFLADFKNLFRLYISDNPVEDLSYLSRLRIFDLKISNTQLKSIDFISSLGKLHRLMLVGNPIADYSPLYSLEDLSVLAITPDVMKKLDTDRLYRQSPGLEIEIVKPKAG